MGGSTVLSNLFVQRVNRSTHTCTKVYIHHVNVD